MLGSEPLCGRPHRATALWERRPDNVPQGLTRIIDMYSVYDNCPGFGWGNKLRCFHENNLAWS